MPNPLSEAVSNLRPVDIQHVDKGVDRINLKQITQRFLQINQLRLARLHSAFNSQQQMFLDLLPLLFHINHPVLPGYMPTGTPTGLRNFKPTRESIKSARQLSRSFALKRELNASQDICAIYLMGSCGTIAHSSNSDIDIWICPAPNLSPTQKASLKEKCRLIEQWATSLRLETHFFIMDDAEFKQKQRAEMDTEDCGNTQHYLLLDEFYRTSILLAGCMPIWWLTPDVFEGEYQHYVDTLKEKRFVDANTYIDYGSAKTIPNQEYLSAGIWHLYKSLASPYKAALKLLLIEVYASEHPHTNNLSSEYKQRIYSGNYDHDELDPYLLIYRKIETYLLNNNDYDRLELIRRCFYFKVGVSLSKSMADTIDRGNTGSNNSERHKPEPNAGITQLPTSVKKTTATDKALSDSAATESETDHRRWQRQLINKLTKEWGWTRKHIHHLDQRQHWPLDQLRAEQNRLTRQLTQCYRLFSALTNPSAEPAVQDNPRQLRGRHNSRELTLLGRQLYAAFERKTAKINRIQCGIVNTLAQAHISFSAQRDEHGQTLWSVQHNQLDTTNTRYIHSQPGAATQQTQRGQKRQQTTAIKTADNPVELLCWCIVNDIVNADTRIHIEPGEHDLNDYEVRQLQSTLLQTLTAQNLHSANAPASSRFAKPARINQCLFVVNAGVDPLKEQKDAGIHRISDKTDPLAFSGIQENLIANITHIAINNWGETFCYHFSGANAIDDCLTHYFSYAKPDQAMALPARKIACACPTRPTAINERIETLFDDIESCYFQKPENFDPSKRYIFESAQAYHVMRWEDQNPIIQQVTCDQDLLANLSKPATVGPLAIDRFALTQHPLHTVYRTAEAANAKLTGNSSQLCYGNITRVFYEVRNQMAYTYILDSRQALSIYTIPFESTRSLILPLGQFIQRSVMRRLTHAHAKTTLADTNAGNSHDYQPYNSNANSAIVEFYGLNPGSHGYSCRQVPTESEISAQYLPIKAIGKRSLLGDIEWRIAFQAQEFSAAELGTTLYQQVAQAIKAHRRDGQNRYRCYITDIDISDWLDNPTLAYELHYKLQLETAINDAFTQLED